MLGPLTLDCDTLLVPDDDQSVVVYSAAAGTPEASALSLLAVVGTEVFLTPDLVDRPPIGMADSRRRAGRLAP